MMVVSNYDCGGINTLLGEEGRRKEKEEKWGGKAFIYGPGGVRVIWTRFGSADHSPGIVRFRWRFFWIMANRKPGIRNNHSF